MTSPSINVRQPVLSRFRSFEVRGSLVGMKISALLALLALCLSCLAQTSGGSPSPKSQPNGKDNLFLTVKPDLMVVVRKHSLGADLVTITALSSTYPPALMREQIAGFGKLVGSSPRGVKVERVSLDASKPELSFLRGSFAVDGMILLNEGKIRIEPLLKAFTGNHSQKTEGWSVIFEGLQPSPTTVRTYDAGPVSAQANYSPDPPGTEYRIRVTTKNPEEISFPDRVPERTVPQSPSAPAGGTPLLVWILVGLASVAAGVLVYSLLLQGGQKKGR